MKNYYDYFEKELTSAPEDCEDYAWLMKDWSEETEDGEINAVKVCRFNEGDREPDSRLTQVCKQKCITVEYTFLSCGTTKVFDFDDVEGAMDFAMKCIAFIKA